jgi:hypothetical protein
VTVREHWAKTRRFGEWALDLTPPDDEVGRLNLSEQDEQKAA